MIQFKSPRIADEFLDLGRQNSRLKQLLTTLELFVELEINKDVYLTCILRTAKENAAVGGIDASPHLRWEAVDLRSSIYSQDEIDRMLAFLNQFTYRNGKRVGVFHLIAGGAPHLHIQYLKLPHGSAGQSFNRPVGMS